MIVLSSPCLYSLSPLGFGRPPLVSLFSERKVKGRKKKNNPKFPKTNQTFTGIFKGLLSWVWTLKCSLVCKAGLQNLVFLPKWKKNWGQPGCNWAGARAPRNGVSFDNQLRASTGSKSNRGGILWSGASSLAWNFSTPLLPWLIARYQLLVLDEGR